MIGGATVRHHHRRLQACRRVQEHVPIMLAVADTLERSEPVVIARDGLLSDCCARAASGHAAAPPMSVMNWRRLRSSMGSSPEPAVPAYRRLTMPRKRPQVLGADLKSSESQPRYPPGKGCVTHNHGETAA